MTARVYPFPSTAMSRVDQLCAAVVRGKSPRPLIDAEPYGDQVLITVGEIEIHVSADVALDVARRIMAAAAEAMGGGE